MSNKNDKDKKDWLQDFLSNFLKVDKKYINIHSIYIIILITAIGLISYLTLEYKENAKRTDNKLQTS